MASTENFDLIVIGCGPAGEKAGAQAAYFGKRVAVIERAAHMGGSCINTGTVPSKTLRESALYFSGLKQRGLYGIDYSLKENLTVQDFMHHERAVVEMERQRILKNLKLHHIELVRGQAAFEDAHCLGPYLVVISHLSTVASAALGRQNFNRLMHYLALFRQFQSGPRS